MRTRGTSQEFTILTQKCPCQFKIHVPFVRCTLYGETTMTTSYFRHICSLYAILASYTALVPLNCIFTILVFLAKKPKFCLKKKLPFKRRCFRLKKLFLPAFSNYITFCTRKTPSFQKDHPSKRGTFLSGIHWHPFF